MANPERYTPGYSFTGWQSSNPDRPLPAPSLDGELADISGAIANHADAIEDLRRSDGALQNGIVTVDSAAPDLLSYIQARTRDGAAASYQIILADDYQLSDNTRVYADLTAGPLTWTMPADPVDGTGLSVQVDSHADVNNLTLLRNGETFNEVAEDLVVDVQNARLDLIFINGTWRY